MEESRTCKKCSETKPIAKFREHDYNPQTRSGTCVDCEKKWKADYNAIYMPAYSHAHRKTNRTQTPFRAEDYVGKEINYWTIIEFTKTEKGKGGQLFRYCLCTCRCGNQKELYFNNIKSGLSKSCGCKPRTDHNEFSGTQILRAYQAMKSRCSNPRLKGYKDYGGRGIKVCDRWLESFYNFLEDMGEPPNKELSIDRKDVNGNYEKSNCRWATRTEQMNNIRKSSLLTASNLAKATGYTRERIRQLSGFAKQCPQSRDLFPYISQIQKEGKNVSVVYQYEAIQFLKDRKVLKQLLSNN